MADNQPVSNLPLTALTPRSIDKGGNLYQVVVIDKGGAGAEDLVSSTNPLEYIPTTPTDGRQVVTTAGTRVNFSNVPCRRVDITGLSTNTGIVVIGADTCIAAVGTRRGTPLVANQAYSIEIDNLNKLYIDSTVNGEGVSYTAYS